MEKREGTEEIRRGREREARKSVEQLSGSRLFLYIISRHSGKGTRSRASRPHPGRKKRKGRDQEIRE
eukprot:scaffold188820_cov18-Tisochrysis_lutea.AAC.1